MQRVIVPAILTLVALTPAAAGPLDLTRETRSSAALAQNFTPPPAAQARAQAPVRMAQMQGQGGGGFFEFLFGGPRYQGRPQDNPYASAGPGQQNPPTYYRPRPGDQPGASSAYYQGSQPYQGMDPRFLPQEVAYASAEKPGTILISTQERFLYLVEGNGRAIRYGIGVGRPGFSWAGVHHVTNKREWPDWTPPDEMVRRRPDLPHHMEGGPENPLGARAMYLGSTLYRIHGSNEPWTIGQAVSSGCIRMRNEDVIDLYNRVRVGTKVIVS